MGFTCRRLEVLPCLYKAFEGVFPTGSSRPWATHDVSCWVTLRRMAMYTPAAERTHEFSRQCTRLRVTRDPRKTSAVRRLIFRDGQSSPVGGGGCSHLILRKKCGTQGQWLERKPPCLKTLDKSRRFILPKNVAAASHSKRCSQLSALPTAPRGVFFPDLGEHSPHSPPHQ